MLSTTAILKTALGEHGVDADMPADVEAYIQQTTASLATTSQIKPYSSSSPALSLVSFQCMLQDTGYPLEIYMPSNVSAQQAASNPALLQERWVGWATEIPGEQPWASRRPPGESVQTRDAPVAVRSKFALPERQHGYLGALLKVYDEANFKPAALVNVVGVVSSAPLPSPLAADEQEPELVPTIHVLLPPTPVTLPTSNNAAATVESTRSALINYLASVFSPSDALAAELIVLTLLSSPVSRPAAQPPLGTLSLNILSPPSQSSTSASNVLIPVIEKLTPYAVTLPLSVPLLHSANFAPKSSDSSSVDAGLLQLGQGTVLFVQEGAMGDGGQLNEKAVKNLQALGDVITLQTLRYDYPYMDGLKLECAVRAIIFSEANSLVQTDVRLQLTGEAITPPTASQNQLEAFRSYLAHQAAQGAKVEIPDAIVGRIQDDFVKSRQSATTSANDAEDELKRRMRIARLLALSHENVAVTVPVWDRAVEIDTELSKRRAARTLTHTQPTPR